MYYVYSEHSEPTCESFELVLEIKIKARGLDMKNTIWTRPCAIFVTILDKTRHQIAKKK